MSNSAIFPEVAAEPLPPSRPTSGRERIVAIDVLRGFAVLGILLVNIQSFAMTEAAYFNPTVVGGLQGADYCVWVLTHILGEQKFMTIFSMLFGAGIVMMSDRQNRSGRSAAALHYRRMAWLLVIGLLHAYLIWYGDILVTYALCGCVVYLFRRLPSWVLVVLGFVCLSFPSILMLAGGLSVPFWPEADVKELELEWAPGSERIEEETAVYRGSWLDHLPWRAESALYVQTAGFLFFLGWRAGGLMLIGMALYRWDVLTGRRPNAFYAALVAAGLIVGIPLIWYGVEQNFAAGWRVTYSIFLGSQYNYWGSVLMSLTYVGLIMLLCRSGASPRALRPLAAVGQMALTNYLVQSILCTTLFYGHGLGQFGHFSRVEQFLTVLAVWAFQLIVSPIWLEFFRFGPFEWLWRSLTYWECQPLLRSGATAN
jgi:uncharacterized protein